MLKCYGKDVYDLEVIKDSHGNERVLVQYGKGGKQHNVPCEAISWVSADWYKK